RADRRQQLAGGFLLPALDLGHVAEADPGVCAELAQGTTLLHPAGPEHVTGEAADQHHRHAPLLGRTEVRRCWPHREVKPTPSGQLVFTRTHRSVERRGPARPLRPRRGRRPGLPAAAARGPRPRPRRPPRRTLVPLVGPPAGRVRRHRSWPRPRPLRAVAVPPGPSLAHTAP